jgi:hypothetical protein
MEDSQPPDVFSLGYYLDRWYMIFKHLGIELRYLISSVAKTLLHVLEACASALREVVLADREL